MKSDIRKTISAEKLRTPLLFIIENKKIKTFFFYNTIYRIVATVVTAIVAMVVVLLAIPEPLHLKPDPPPHPLQLLPKNPNPTHFRTRGLQGPPHDTRVGNTRGLQAKWTSPPLVLLIPAGREVLPPTPTTQARLT